jgi:hypothetical protein
MNAIVNQGNKTLEYSTEREVGQQVVRPWGSLWHVTPPVFLMFLNIHDS